VKKRTMNSMSYRKIYGIKMSKWKCWSYYSIYTVFC